GRGFVERIAWVGGNLAVESAATLGRLAQARIGLAPFAQTLLVELDRTPVMRREQIEADLLGTKLLEHVLDQEEALLRLRHLLAAERHHAVVQPEVDERLAGRRLGLRDLVLVVREDEILSAAVQVERLAEILHGHGRAL